MFFEENTCKYRLSFRLASLSATGRRCSASKSHIPYSRFNSDPKTNDTTWRRRNYCNRDTACDLSSPYTTHASRRNAAVETKVLTAMEKKIQECSVGSGTITPAFLQQHINRALDAHLEGITDTLSTMGIAHTVRELRSSNENENKSTLNLHYWPSSPSRPKLNTTYFN